jgi:hypothetical protein
MEEQQVKLALNGLASSESTEEKAKLLRMMCSSFSVGAVGATPAYRYPFNLILERPNWKNGRPW